MQPRPHQQPTKSYTGSVLPERPLGALALYAAHAQDCMLRWVARVLTSFKFAGKRSPSVNAHPCQTSSGRYQLLNSARKGILIVTSVTNTTRSSSCEPQGSNTQGRYVATPT